MNAAVKVDDIKVADDDFNNERVVTDVDCAPMDGKDLSLIGAPAQDGVSNRFLATNSEYPIGHLPVVIRETIFAIHDVGQVAFEIAGQSVLAGVSLAAQHLSDVKAPRIGQKPLSNYFLSLAESGAGKTTAEGFAMVAVNAHIDALEVEYEKQLHDHSIDLQAYRTELKQVERDMRGHPRDAIGDALRAVGNPPLPPLRPDAITKMTTYSGLLNFLRDGQPSVGLINDDSSGFLKDTLNDPSTVTLMTDMWSGTPYRRVTARERLLLKGRRLTAHLMVQPKHADAMLHGEHTAEQGIIPRFNIAIATPMEKAAPKGDVTAHMRVIEEFNQRIAELLAHEGSVRNRNEVFVERPLEMDEDAECLFIAFMEEMSAASQPGGSLAAIRSSAVRAPENAARLAGVMTLFCHGPEKTIIELPEMTAAIALMYYFNNQKLSLYGASFVDPDQQLAGKVWQWLSERWDDPLVSQRDLCRFGIPAAVRRVDRAVTVINLLERQGHLVRLDGKHMVKGEPRERVWRIER